MDMESPAAAAADRLFDELYADLKRLARARLHRDGRVADLDTTALVHEAWLRLADRGSGPATLREEAAFFGYVGRVMRSVVIDHVRERQAAKRGGDQVFVTLSTELDGERVDDERLLAVDEALVALERLAPELRELVEMRYFAGLSVDEVARLRDQSPRTVAREWDKARGLLRRLLDEA
jgi:RNA polymerase sigma factor (TIGR02999 family)